MNISEILEKVEQSYDWSYVGQEGSFATRFDYAGGGRSIWVNHSDGSVEGSIPPRLKKIFKELNLFQHEKY